MKLIVGLGNPGINYQNTRHNIGFMVLDKIAYNNNITFKKGKFDYEYTELITTEKIILLKPLRYMNLSGEVLKEYVNYYKINIDDIIVISDDLDLPLGKIRLRYKGSSGGHNGLKNIEFNLCTNEFKRIKVGIGHSNNVVDYVLSKFSQDELIIINESINKIEDIINNITKYSFIDLMNKYN